MWRLIFCIAAITEFSFAKDGVKKPLYDLNNSIELFEKFTRCNNLRYTDREDRRRHLTAFRKMLERIREGFIPLCINEFADSTSDEIKNVVLGNPTKGVSFKTA